MHIDIKRPTDNPLTYTRGDFTIEFRDVMELCQGCPEVGCLVINGIPQYRSSRFGTNVLLQNNWLILPLYTRGFLQNGFKLGAFNLSTLELTIISALEPLTMPYRVEGDRVEYFTDLANQQSKWTTLPH